MTVEPAQATSPAASGHDVPAALRRAAVQACRAPSVHNTQPWRFVLRGGVVEVHADWTRHVSSYDPLGRQLLMSCGCALFNLRASLAASGWAAETVRFPDPRRRQVVAVVAPRIGHPDRGLRRLDHAIERRRTSRGVFAGPCVGSAAQAALRAAAEAEGATGEFLAEAGGTEFRDLTVLANRLHNADAAYRAELRAWTLPEWGRRDGVPGGRAAISLLPGHEEDMGAPDCLVLSTRADDPDAWLCAGEALERVLLEATARGLATRPMTQVIEVPELRDRLRTALARQALQPQVAVLLGQAPPAPPTRRRRLVDLITEVG